jgi:hypothetical protein
MDDADVRIARAELDGGVEGTVAQIAHGGGE